MGVYRACGSLHGAVVLYTELWVSNQSYGSVNGAVSLYSAGGSPHGAVVLYTELWFSIHSCVYDIALLNTQF